MWSSKILLVTAGAALLVFAALLIGLYSKTPFSEEALYYFNKDFLGRAAEYQRISLQIYLARTLIMWAGLAGLLLFSWRYFSRLAPIPLAHAAAYIALIFLVLYLITLPLDYYRGFVVESRFGLTAHTPASWAADYLLNRSISLLLTVLSFTGLYALMQYFPARWWYIAGVLSAVFIIAGTYLYPLIIDPLFYNFKPLQDEAMNSRIIIMTEDVGIKVDEVLVADASRKTMKANAYFTGLGSSKRIVVYDTLLSGFSQHEALAVIAHEIAHWKYAHITKGILLGIGQAFLTLFLLSLALKELGITQAAGSRADFRAIIIALLFFTLLSFVSMPFENAISRAFEREADLKAVELTRMKELQVTLHKNLAQANLSDVEPHPLIKAVLYTHPPTLERINLVK
ncbi:MAG: M48 family metallopeptidase [Bacillota bacterium]|nr:M48 family metallopeptidase [Bacillota bacterium]